MSHTFTMATAVVMLGFVATGTAHAAAASSHEFSGAHPGYWGALPEGYQPQQSVAPQFNNPGPQIRVPQPGNPVDQLPPLMGAGQPDALGIK
jgi:hypothetical protein